MLLVSYFGLQVQIVRRHFVCEHMHTFVHTRIPACVCLCVYVYVCVYAHMHAFACVPRVSVFLPCFGDQISH